jgi:hypothetical protein
MDTLLTIWFSCSRRFLDYLAFILFALSIHYKGYSKNIPNSWWCDKYSEGSDCPGGEDEANCSG